MVKTYSGAAFSTYFATLEITAFLGMYVWDGRVPRLALQGVSMSAAIVMQLEIVCGIVILCSGE